MGKRCKALICLLAATLLLSGCGEKQKVLDSVDGLVYSFIVGKVEGNDDLLSDVLIDDAEGILKPGRHAFPGAAEKMGTRYQIERFDHDYKDGALYYKIQFYRHYTDKISEYNVLVLNTQQGWLVADIGSMEEELMRQLISQQEGVMIHAYEGEGTK